MLGLTKKYKESKIEVDKLSEFFADRQKFESTNQKVKNEKKTEVNIPISPSSIHEKLLSTTALSKELGISSKELFSKI